MDSIKLNEIENYLINKTEKKFRSLRKKAEFDKEKIFELIDKIKTSAIKFSRSKDRELFKDLSSDTKKHELAVKASEKLQQGILENLNQIQTSEKITYESLLKLTEDTRIFFSKLNEIGRKWVPKMSPWFKQELKEFDYYIRKLAEYIEKFNIFLLKEYKEIDKFDKTLEVATSLTNSLIQKENLSKLIEQINTEIDKIKETIGEEQRKYNEFKEKGIQKDFEDIKIELQTIRRGFNTTINPIIKPLSKFSKSPSNFKGQLTTAQRDLIDKYSENPFNTFINEKENLEDIKNILDSLDKSLKNNELELKRSRIDKAIKQIKKILDEKIFDSMYSKAKEIIALKNKLESEIKQSDVLQKNEKMEDTINQIENKFSDKNVEFNHTKTEYANLIDKIERDKINLIEKIKEIIEEEVNITLN